jgi:hypothetical protein
MRSVLAAFALVLLVAAAPARSDEAAAAFAAGLPERQPELLRAAAEALAPQRPGIADLYVISVAGSAEAEVFRREAESARALFDERFDAVGRSALLVNSRTSALNVPLASPESLRRMIRAAVARMDPQEDVLALYFTSHGLHGRLSMRFPELAIGDLTPEALRRMLDEAGVVWSIVIISACHSGSFIPALEGDRTLVLTAAAATRTSFGCKDENDFTYFGKALIGEELRRSFSLLDAFEAAKRTIAQREAAEGFRPSMPEAYVGDAIRGKLAEIEARLKRLAAERRG